MSASRERTRSIWMDTEVCPRAPMLGQDLTVDTVVVGSGIAGLSTAYELAVEGRKVAVPAACTHLGCHVHWNSLERCWDCPCHGSHFAVDGTALNGPAISPLADAEAPRKSGA